jgi:hypothetical protein
MSKGIELPELREEDLTPVTQRLLELLQQLPEKVLHQDEIIRQLKDEIAVLKKQSKRPKIRPSHLDKNTSQRTDKEDTPGKKRRGSHKRRKTKDLKIHKDEVVAPDEQVPNGSRFKGYRDYVVQGLAIEPFNVRYRLECWKTPDGRYVRGKLPESVQGHYSPTLISFILYQHYHAHVTAPILLEQLREWGVDISSGQLSRILVEGKESFHEEKAGILNVGLQNSSYVTVDDTGARHAGKNGYCTHIGNGFFAWFETTYTKSRINFLELLRAGHTDYVINEEALAYMENQKLPKGPLARLQNDCGRVFADSAEWNVYLLSEEMTTERHMRVATEGALLGSVLNHGLAKDLAIVSDDAGQFDVFLHALCWVHAERTIHKLVPFNDAQREALDSIRSEIWELYADLKSYKEDPTSEEKVKLEKWFDELFTTKTCFYTLNEALKRLHKNKEELLLVLERPDIPLHTNGSETDIREYVKKRKISGGTRSDSGRRCRDTFATLKKTCRKLGISFWEYLTDRLCRLNQIAPLPSIIEHRIADSRELSS